MSNYTTFPEVTLFPELFARCATQTCAPFITAHLRKSTTEINYIKMTFTMHRLSQYAWVNR